MSPANPAHRNRLASESSPYLQQHASNPVDWHPWSEEALQRARREQKPILLSIGYAACHWCHVMAHESFEDEATAALMNELYVNIKVDREERPDLDKIYQVAHQVLTQRSGGWPLTMFLTHDDQQPFFGGTYFPPAPRHGMPAFREILMRVAEYYRQHLAEIRQQNASLMRVFADLRPPPAGSEMELHRAPLDKARQELERQFDNEDGGFGGAPKFPHGRTLDFLLRYWRATGGSDEPDLHALYMSTLTLMRMAEGGIYDQLGGGFCRYSVDRHWTIPHFEKMLYDNAELLRVYADAALATGEPLFMRVAAETAAWMQREMGAPEGAYCSTLDADSEGHEGRFYVWDREQAQALLPQKEFALFARRFGLDRPPNFEGHWHLRVSCSLEELAKEFQTTVDEAHHALQAARTRLLEVRQGRVWPGFDQKILTAWNGLAIGALASAARALNDDALLAAAQKAADFVHEQLWREGRLLAVYKDGQARLPAYLDDHAFLLDALVELLQTRWRNQDLEFAIALAEAMLRHFSDSQHGGFYFTADDHEALIHRPKSFADDALPSGNAIAARALNRLGYLLGETRYLEAAAATLRAAWNSVEHYPSGHAASLIALEEFLYPPQLVLIRGEAGECEQWHRDLSRVYAPRRMVFAIPAELKLAGALAEKKALPETVAYVCRGTTCSAPLKSLAALIAVTHE